MGFLLGVVNDGRPRPLSYGAAGAHGLADHGTLAALDQSGERAQVVISASNPAVSAPLSWRNDAATDWEEGAELGSREVAAPSTSGATRAHKEFLKSHWRLETESGDTSVTPGTAVAVVASVGVPAETMGVEVPKLVGLSDSGATPPSQHSPVATSRTARIPQAVPLRPHAGPTDALADNSGGRPDARAVDPSERQAPPPQSSSYDTRVSGRAPAEAPLTPTLSAAPPVGAQPAVSTKLGDATSSVDTRPAVARAGRASFPNVRKESTSPTDPVRPVSSASSMTPPGAPRQNEPEQIQNATPTRPRSPNRDDRPDTPRDRRSPAVEPRVHIGHVEIVVMPPPNPTRSAAAASPRPSSLASRLYLRNI